MCRIRLFFLAKRWSLKIFEEEKGRKDLSLSVHTHDSSETRYFPPPPSPLPSSLFSSAQTLDKGGEENGTYGETGYKKKKTTRVVRLGHFVATLTINGYIWVG